MAYEKTVWVNGQAPALDAYHLNKMEQGIADAVSVTPQTLTDEQKAQARGNIGAAPDGFGLGGDAKVLTSDDDVNTIGASGWYCWANNNVPINAIGVTSLTIMRVDAYSSGVKVQTLYGATDGVEFIMQPIVARRMIYGSKIGAWEYVNPPMQLGVEYRTTERYLGKPVYVKAVDTGALPNATYKTVEASFPNANAIVDFGGEAFQDSEHFIHLPCQRYGKDAYDVNVGVQVVVGFNSITISAATNFSSFTSSSVWVKYTKSTG